MPNPTASRRRSTKSECVRGVDEAPETWVIARRGDAGPRLPPVWGPPGRRSFPACQSGDRPRLRSASGDYRGAQGRRIWSQPFRGRVEQMHPRRPPAPNFRVAAAEHVQVRVPRVALIDSPVRSRWPATTTSLPTVNAAAPIIRAERSAASSVCTRTSLRSRPNRDFELVAGGALEGLAGTGKAVDIHGDRRRDFLIWTSRIGAGGVTCPLTLPAGLVPTACAKVFVRARHSRRPDGVIPERRQRDL